jgi:hypothetical protein
LAQLWWGTLTRVYLPPLAAGRLPWLTAIDPAVGPEHQLLPAAAALFATPAQARQLGDLEDTVLEGLADLEGPSFRLHDLLRYRSHWLTELPFYERRALLEQAFAEGAASGQAQGGHWQLGTLYPPLNAEDGELSDPWQRTHTYLRRFDTPYGRGDRHRPSILCKLAPETINPPVRLVTHDLQLGQLKVVQ